MRLSETEARTVLLVRAVEETDPEGVLLSPRTRAAASRRAIDEAPDAHDDTHLRRRAALLRDDLVREAPALERFLQPRRVRTPLVLAVLVVAVVLGAASNLLGPERRVSVLAFPLAGILGWNLLVYAALIARTMARAVARLRGRPRRASRLAAVGRWLEGGGRLERGAPSRAATAAAARFQRLWLVTAAPLLAARARTVLHLAAAATAAGAVAGMYVSGVALEYRATWESTWLEAPAVQRYVDVVLGPAARLLDRPIPDVGPLRGPGNDGPAAPWIHLWATTLGLVVVGPRCALALVTALAGARLARWLPVHLDPAYARLALHAGRGATTAVEVVYYSCAPEARLRERLHTTLQERAGARAVIRDAASLAYGDGAERVPVPADPSLAVLFVVVFTLAQTPEPEVHGEFLERLRARLAPTGWSLLVVLETATYRQRIGSATRVSERRAAWDRLLRELSLTAETLE
jgi:hypothetical protein